MEEQIDIILTSNTVNQPIQKETNGETTKYSNGSTKQTVSNVNSESNGSLNRNAKPPKTEWVRLNIGGQCFVTTKTTLCKNAHSFFYKLCQDDPTVGLTTDKVV